MSARNEGELTSEQTFAAFKFYEEAAEKTKAHAWTQTTWLLALNAGLFAFSVNFYAEHEDVRGFWLIEFVAAGVGVVLCRFLIYVLDELGEHIRGYWTSANKLAARYAPLAPFVAQHDLADAQELGYRAPFPRFCRRLQRLATLFLWGHVILLSLIAYLVLT